MEELMNIQAYIGDWEATFGDWEATYDPYKRSVVNCLGQELYNLVSCLDCDNQVHGLARHKYDQDGYDDEYNYMEPLKNNLNLLAKYIGSGLCFDIFLLDDDDNYDFDHKNYGVDEFDLADDKNKASEHHTLSSSLLSSSIKKKEFLQQGCDKENNSGRKEDEDVDDEDFFWYGWYKLRKFKRAKERSRV